MHELNRPEIVAEVARVFQRYESALTANDIETLDALFWNSEHAIRFGVGENLYGYATIAQFRAARSPTGRARELFNTCITTFGNDFATVHTEFRAHTSNGGGRQSQTWWRTPQGWRIVSAHISLLEPPRVA